VIKQTASKGHKVTKPSANILRLETMSIPLYTLAPNSEMSAQVAAAVAEHGNLGTLNLDDIFGDVMFTPDGETVFLSEQGGDPILHSGEGNDVRIIATKVQGNQAVPVPAGGGLSTTNLADPTKPALCMGPAPTTVIPTAQAVPFKKTPQEPHHMQFAATTKRKRSSTRTERRMSDQQKTDRRYVGTYYLLVSDFCL
jgi:hypothetical protein